MSKTLKQLVSRGLHRISSRTVVLLYHRVTKLDHDPWGIAVQPKNFAEQLQVVREIGAVALRDTEPGSLRPFSPACSVAVTFDDGYADNYRQALPLLEKFEVPATIFVATGYTGKAVPFWWDDLQALLLGSKLKHNVEVSISGQPVTLYPVQDEHPIDALKRVHPLLQQLDAAERNEALAMLRETVRFDQAHRSADFAMNEEELEKIAASPFIEVGAHTVTHPKLSALPPRRQREEIEESKKYLEDTLGKRITSFAYPFGGAVHFTEATEKIVISAGFHRTCTTEAVVYGERHTAFRIPRLYAPDIDGEKFSHWLRSYLRS